MHSETEAQKERIREISQEIGFDPEDPMFQILSILGNFEEAMEHFPIQIEALLEAGALMLDTKLQAASKSAEVMQHAVISSAVKEVLKQEIHHLKPNVSLGVEAPQLGKVKLGFWAISGILGGMIGLGAILGTLTTQNVLANYVGDLPEAALSLRLRTTGVTANEFKLLQWANSTEGKEARQIIMDNRVELEVCRRDNRLFDRCVIKLRKYK